MLSTCSLVVVFCLHSGHVLYSMYLLRAFGVQAVYTLCACCVHGVYLLFACDMLSTSDELAAVRTRNGGCMRFTMYT